MLYFKLYMFWLKRHFPGGSWQIHPEPGYHTTINILAHTRFLLLKDKEIVVGSAKGTPSDIRLSYNVHKENKLVLQRLFKSACKSDPPLIFVRCIWIHQDSPLQTLNWGIDWFPIRTGGHGSVRLTVGLDDLRDLFQPKWFCESMT